MQGPCEHCGNPDKSLWTRQCQYKGDYSTRRDFVISTFDAPCSFDSYDEGQDELRRFRRNEVIGIAIALVIGLGGGTLLLNAMFGFLY